MSRGKRRLLLRGAWIVGLCAALMAAPGSSRVARAGGIVGTGTPQSCTEAALDAVLSGGGSVSFNCGPNPHTILITSTKTISNYVVIDGNNRITLDGGDAVRLFIVLHGAQLYLIYLTLAHGKASGAEEALGGALRNDGGVVLILGSTLIENSAFCENLENCEAYGGALFNAAAGIMLVHGTTLQNNQTLSPLGAAKGGAIYNAGRLESSHNHFNENLAGNAGGAIYSTAELTHYQDTFDGNRTEWADGRGGAVYAEGEAEIEYNHFEENVSGLGGALLLSSGAFTVTQTTFYSNTAEFMGGAVYNEAALTLEESQLRSNQAAESGGAIANSDNGELMVIGGDISYNQSASGGGIFNPLGAKTTITGCQFTANLASGNPGGFGGAIYNAGGEVAVSESSFANNHVDPHAGARWPARGGAIASSGALLVSSSTFTGNHTTGEGRGGVLFTTGGVYSVTNSTFTQNYAPNGSVIYSLDGALAVRHATIYDNWNSAALVQAGGTVTLTNSLAANTSGAANCAGSILDGGGNLQFGGLNPASCGALIPIGDPHVAALADHGGKTLTMAPAPGSPLIDAAASSCPTTDQRGYSRLSPCETGAYELDGSLTQLLALTNPTFYGDPVTFSVKVFGFQPTGVVTFTLGTEQRLLDLGSNGVISTTIEGLLPGTYPVSAEYGGDAHNHPSIVSLAGGQVVYKLYTAVRLESFPNPAALDQPVTITGTMILYYPYGVTPTGGLTFLDGGAEIAGCVDLPLSVSRAVCQAGLLAAGMHEISAHYSGDAIFGPSQYSSLVRQNVGYLYYFPKIIKDAGYDNCDLAYPTVCLPTSPHDLDCGDIPYTDFEVLYPDPHNFDANGDGIGCGPGD